MGHVTVAYMKGLVRDSLLLNMSCHPGVVIGILDGGGIDPMY